MSLAFDAANLVIESTSSIIDLPAFHAALRDWEDSEIAAVYPVTHTWKALDLGGGAFFYQCDLANGWRLKFPNAGNYTIEGNLNGAIVPTTNVYVERKTSAAYTTTAIGGTGPSLDQIATAVWQRVLESDLNAEQLLRIMLATLAGKTNGIGSDEETYRGQDGTTARVVATFDSAGNRLDVQVNGA